MLIPISTDIRIRKAPVANVALIVVNVVVYVFTDGFGGEYGRSFKDAGTLDAALPLLYQYITYQFLHGDVLHLVGNMLFLYIFGNAVCDKMGNTCYTFFYVASGVFAGVMFASTASNPIVGASGAIAAVTTAFLVLFPRSRINMLLIFVFITTFELPSMILILFKIILWDNIIAPAFDQQIQSNVAYSAHLAGYGFGFAVALLLLKTRGVARNQFDLPALWDRWRRRTGLVSGGGRVAAPAARPINVRELDSRPLAQVELSPTDKLRREVLERIADRDAPEAARLYLKLLDLDPDQTLPRQAQLDIANQLAQDQMHEQAGAAYEAFLTDFPTSADADQVRLLLGLIYSRYLRHYEKAADHLRQALPRLTQESQRSLAEAELRIAESHFRGPKPSEQ